jgi:hypothetical protein
MYVCCSPLSPSPNFFVQQSALQNRLPFWFAAKHGAQGFLYYETGRSMALNSTLSWGGFPGTYGDGIFVYPGPEGPINTNRLEYIRMGIQDVEYFLLLKSLISSMPENSELYMEAKKLLSVDESLIKSSVSYCSDWNAFAEKKHSIGLLIEKILNDKK